MKTQHPSPLTSLPSTMQCAVHRAAIEIQVPVEMSEASKFGAVSLACQDPKSLNFDSTFATRIGSGARSVGWAENELEAWLLSRKANRNGGVL